ncbi:MAG: quinone-dependent dihydroorotate dehydrogenase [Rhodospirillales bacterium]
MSLLYRALWPALRRLDPETAHNAAIRVLRAGLIPPPPGGADQAADPVLKTQVCGMDFSNPLGLAAGFDKSAEAPRALYRAGFGFVEIGSVTPRPQPGNPKPRLFRLEQDRAVINRMGFNNAGADVVHGRLTRARARSHGLAGPLGVNLGRNKDSEDAAADYAQGARRFAALADYLVVNVSSPNTPGLRDLQGRAALEDLLAAVTAAITESAAPKTPALFVKVAPDLDDKDILDITEVCTAAGVSGLIATNTTTARPKTLVSMHKAETGGLSGAPLTAPSTEILRRFHTAAAGRLVLIGVGGVFNGEDAYAKIRAGAALVQLYSALVYEGPGLVPRILRDLAARLKADGFTNIAEAAGTGRGG